MELFDYNRVIITGFKISPCQQYLGAVVEGSPDVYDGHIVKMEVGGQCRLVECIQDISNMGKLLQCNFFVFAIPL